LVIAAWTATELLDYAVGSEPHVDVTLHRDGDLSAAVVGARVTRPRSTKPVSVDELIRRRMWWHHLGRSIAVDVHRDGMPPGAGHAVGDEMVWDDLDILVRLAFDADLIGSEPQMWWHGDGARLRVLFATDRPVAIGARHRKTADRREFEPLVGHGTPVAPHTFELPSVPGFRPSTSQ
jgi:hypothetical protein